MCLSCTLYKFIVNVSSISDSSLFEFISNTIMASIVIPIVISYISRRKERNIKRFYYIVAIGYASEIRNKCEEILKETPGSISASCYIDELKELINAYIDEVFGCLKNGELSVKEFEKIIGYISLYNLSSDFDYLFDFEVSKITTKKVREIKAKCEKILKTREFKKYDKSKYITLYKRNKSKLIVKEAKESIKDNNEES